jgi:hypothetical protein
VYISNFSQKLRPEMTRFNKGLIELQYFQLYQYDDVMTSSG